MKEPSELSNRLRELSKVMEKPNIRPLVSMEQLWFNVAELVQIVKDLNKELENLKEAENHDLRLIRAQERTINKLEKRIIDLERRPMASDGLNVETPK